MTDQDSGTLEAILKRLPYRIKRAKELKSRVDAGHVLRDSDVDFLKRVFKDSETTNSLIDRNPKYHKLAAQMVKLYHHITAAALENEKKL